MRTSDPVFLALSLLFLADGSVSQDDGLCMTENSTVPDGGMKAWYNSTESSRIDPLYCTVMYGGVCRGPYEDGLCGLGERLFLRNATAQCDCDEVDITLYQFSFLNKLIIIIRAGWGMKAAVTKSSPRHFAKEPTWFSIWEPVINSRMERHSAASEIPVLALLIHSPTGESQLEVQFYKIASKDSAGKTDGATMSLGLRMWASANSSPPILMFPAPRWSAALLTTDLTATGLRF